MRAYAKLNLSLKILGKRDDGYHILKSEMIKISLADEVTVSSVRSDKIAVRVTCSDGRLPVNEKNTACKAALLYMKDAGIDTRTDINITKRIPVGAGLGGGSADAAAVLRLMEDQYKALGEEKLLRTAAAAGADVPFALFGNHAMVGGIGEQIIPLPLKSATYLICKPPASLSTAGVFAEYDRDAGVHATNDLFPPALRLCPELGEIEKAMLELGLEPRMSGSGSTMFCETDGDGAEIERILKSRFSQHIIQKVYAVEDET